MCSDRVAGTKVLTADDQGQLYASGAPTTVEGMQILPVPMGGEDELRHHLDKRRTIATRASKREPERALAACSQSRTTQQ